MPALLSKRRLRVTPGLANRANKALQKMVFGPERNECCITPHEDVGEGINLFRDR